MTYIIIVGVYAGRDGLYTDYGDLDIKRESKKQIETKDGLRIKALPPTNAVKGHKPDIVILKADVSQEYYNNILKPCVGNHGVIIDESKRT